MNTRFDPKSRKLRIRDAIKALAIFSAWSSISISLFILLKATWSSVVMARGSDMLVSLYHVSAVPASIALGPFSVCTLVYALSLLETIIPVPRTIGRMALIALMPSTIFLSLGFHAITVSSKHEKREMNEFIGPFMIRSFQARDHEEPIQAYCRNKTLIAVDSGGGEKRIFLGVGYWTISQDVCSDTRLSGKR